MLISSGTSFVLEEETLGYTTGTAGTAQRMPATTMLSGRAECPAQNRLTHSTCSSLYSSLDEGKHQNTAYLLKENSA